MPGADESGFILNSFKQRDLLVHFRPFNGKWWHDVLTVNQFYPPAVLLVNGALKAILGASHWVDKLSVVGFSLVWSASVFAIARLLTKDTLTAVLAVIFLNLFPRSILSTPS